MAHRLLRDVEKDGWERSDLPITCESCLGDNPRVQMTTAQYDKECKICTRPFTVFRWRPGRDARFKKTEVCQTCSKLKNVCQVCLLDLEYGLPVQVRDTALQINTHDSIPKSDVNRECFAEEHDRRAAAGFDYESSYGKERANETILKLQRTTPNYERNRAQVCSFFVRGECTRGAECPYRHEMSVTGEFSHQNIKDRYYGINDPVASKLLNRAGEMPSLEAPLDESLKTLYVGGIDKRVTEQDLRDNFYAHGEIESIRIVLNKACAFVAYTTREGAEKAAQELSNRLVINGVRLKLHWGKPQQPKPESEGSDDARAAVAQSGLLPRAVNSQQNQLFQPPGSQDQAPRAPIPYFNIAPQPHQERAYYPSMDPQRMGAVISSQEGSSNVPGGSMKKSQQQGSQYGYHQYMPPPPGQGQYQEQFYPPPHGYAPQQQPPPYQQYLAAMCPPYQPPPAIQQQHYQHSAPPPASQQQHHHQHSAPPPASQQQHHQHSPPPSVAQEHLQHSAPAETSDH